MVAASTGDGSVNPPVRLLCLAGNNAVAAVKNAVAQMIGKIVLQARVLILQEFVEVHS